MAAFLRAQHPMAVRLPWFARLLRAYLRTNLPGRTGFAHYLATRIPSLRRVPIQIAEGQVLYLDMRDAMCRDTLRDSPYTVHPWEPDEQAVIRRVVRAGDVAFDIGGHFGEHAVLLGSLVGPRGRVFVFEPNPERLDGLRRTVMTCGNGQVLGVAVSDRVGPARLYVPEFHVTASLADWTKGRVGPVREMTCEQVTLDGLIDRGTVLPPDFVKCDVEGAELFAFRGAARTLDRPDAPIVMYEANLPGAQAFGLSMSASTDFLAALAAPRYSFYWVQPHGTLVPIRELRPDVTLFNLLAVPAARRDRLEGAQVVPESA